MKNQPVNLKKENIPALHKTAPRTRVNLRKPNANRPCVSLRKPGYGK